MAKQVTIKQIAELAGVSPGTVDRVLHNRGKVSEKNMEKIMAAIDSLGYRSNLHTSAVALKKTFRIYVIIPQAIPGEYWEGVVNGISDCIEEYSAIDLECVYKEYDQYDPSTFTESASAVLEADPDAVVIGPTFDCESLHFCKELEKRNIPYAFVDSSIAGTSPVITAASDQNACGRLLANMFLLTDNSGTTAIFNPRRSGGRESHNSIVREKAMKEYYDSHCSGSRIKRTDFSIRGQDREIVDYLRDNPDVKSIAVLNSKGHIVADILKKHRITGITVGGFDLTADNIRCLREGSMSFVLSQNQDIQGFEALKGLVEYLVFRKISDTIRSVKVDVILRENCPGQ